MTKNKRILLGFASFTPIAVYVISFGSDLLMESSLHDFSGAITLISFIGVVSGIALIVYYISDVIKNSSRDNTWKISWMIWFFFFSALALPFYWYYHIWRRQEEPPAIPGIVQKNGLTFCQKCGTQIHHDSYKNYRCVKCGYDPGLV